MRVFVSVFLGSHVIRLKKGPKRANAGCEFFKTVVRSCFAGEKTGAVMPLLRESITAAGMQVLATPVSPVTSLCPFVGPFFILCFLPGFSKPLGACGRDEVGMDTLIGK